MTRVNQSFDVLYIWKKKQAQKDEEDLMATRTRLLSVWSLSMCVGVRLHLETDKYKYDDQLAIVTVSGKARHVANFMKF